MDGSRQLEAFCEICGEPTTHVSTPDDPGTCVCGSCGTMQQMMVPLA